MADEPDMPTAEPVVAVESGGPLTPASRTPLGWRGG